MNLPNNITLTRIAAIPLMLWVLRTSLLSDINGEREIVAATIFILASLTDGFDGYLARKRNQVTTLGMLLDPLADKLWITAGFVSLVQFNPTMVPAWIAVVIIGREFLVSGLRSIAATQGFTIEASNLGKFKMVVQIITIAAAIFDRRWAYWQLGGFILPIHWIAKVTIWIMVVLSLWSAADYFAAFWSKIAGTADKRRKRRAFILSRRRKSDVAAG
ncbi:MAG: CDP-diacylglycerol--glycerol-3-phosphate 3-phosphatidyltransferase [Candidatus Koribacter versatilis]|uniref:CDP-diacylglycerol--glycerol-3-phosphate 3-phosphatidyltransferase n=1 Tax=Candidatus Korobacter versatilis TaxID=658062 RepID=A0A932A8Z2_9BACT|nr:CDP-diacylglycerol--glycerol-3-phosphate 3-phosphatidyltransferase [Candidatus Koribacter versatilis]